MALKSNIENFPESNLNISFSANNTTPNNIPSPIKCEGDYQVEGLDSSKLESPRHTCNTSHGTIRRTFEHAFDMELPPIGNHGYEGDQSEDAFCDERKVKSLKQVEVVAWIILITISIECFIGEFTVLVRPSPSWSVP